MFFRPARGATIAVLIMLPILIGLGIWQLQRLHWKEGILTALDRNMHAAPISLDAPRDIPNTLENQYLRVTLHGRFLNAKESYLFASDVAGDPGYHVVTPLETPDHRIFLIDRGYVPESKRDPASHSQPPGAVAVTGLWRWSETSGLFTPAHDSAHRVFYVRDANAIAKADGLKLAQPVIIDADTMPNPGGWPKGGQTVIDIPNNHLDYALTWFGLAIVLLGVYLSWHISRGRLGLREPH